MKVLWVGDAIYQSGFSIVTHNICNELCTKCDVVLYGIRYDGKIKHPYPYYIYPAQGPNDFYSFEYFATVIESEKPDVIVIFNDDAIILRYMQMLGTDLSHVVPFFPVNYLPVNSDVLLEFSRLGVSHVMTYTNFSSKRIKAVNPNLEVSAVYHGVAPSIFFKTSGAKASLGVEEYFIVGNNNTNTYRKRLDLFLKGFAKFAKGKNDVKCLIHATNKDVAYDLKYIAVDLGITGKTILSSSPLEFDKLNTLYNIMDVNVNTSMGEGFGLSLIEGAACKVPVLCPPHGNLKEIWNQGTRFIDIKDNEYIAGTNFVGDVISEDSLADNLDLLYSDRDLLLSLGSEAYEHSRKDKFSWKVVASEIYKVLGKVNGNKLSFIS